MEELLKEELKENENLLWTGKPESFKTMDKVYKPSLIKKVAAMTLLVAALSAAYIGLASSRGISVKSGVIILLLACILGTAVRPFLDANKLKKHTLYAISDSRLFIVNDTVKAVPFVAVKEAAMVTDEAGHTSLVCGADAVKYKPAAFRVASASAPRCNEESGVCEVLVMYAIPEADKVKKILAEYITF